MSDRIRVQHPTGGQRRTKDSMALESDVNTIVKRHTLQGTRLPGPEGPHTYGDFSNAVDYHTAMNRVLAAREQFMQLPSHIRTHCKNDPGQFLDLVFDPERRAELVQLGLVEHEVPPAAATAPAAPDPAPDTGETA